MNKQEIEKKIVDLMQKTSYKPLSEEEILNKIAIEGSALKLFWEVMQEMQQVGTIVCTRFNTYGLPEKMNLFVGALSLNSKGFGFVLSANRNEKDIFIPPGQLLGAMNNDCVIARINSRPEGRQPEGEIIRILKRANTKIVGNFSQRKEFGFVVPDDKKVMQDNFVARKNFGGAKDGQKVVVEITVWPRDGKSAEGQIVEILGIAGDSGLEVLSIIKQHGLPTEFPEKVLTAAKKVHVTVEEKELAGRRDLRERLVVTIDSDDAKDLDDAVYVERLANDSWLLGVYIADVSHYVTENSLLDQEARLRGTSVYLVDRVLPMLPKRLSNGICSLNAQQDRLVMACEMQIDKQGQVTKYDIFPAVINVTKRLSYDGVRQMLLDEVFPEDIPLPLAEMLKYMAGLSTVLRSKRMRRGAIDFDFPEQKVILDDNGKPIEIKQRVRTIAESLIEEFMLAANETVAEHLFKLMVPSIYRVHEDPDDDKMSALAILLNNFAIKMPAEKKITPAVLQEVLSKIAGKPEEKLVAKVILRSLRQAEYRAENLGHFGLAAKYYTHFTSPIRRYPDLVVHRLLKETAKGKVSDERKVRLAETLPEIAKQSSKQERAAEQAERDTVDLKKAEYMLDFIGEQFDGTISGVTAFGLFVELANGVEGLLHMSALNDDYYIYVEEKYCLIGEATKKVYRMGDPIRVEVLQANISTRSVDFILPDQTLATRERLLARAKENSSGNKNNTGKGKAKGGKGKSKTADKPYNKPVKKKKSR